MKVPLVTVGISFHNEARYLRSAVESILRQTMSDFELLLVDDGSTDGSLEIARSFTRDPRVRVSSDGVNRKLGARLNEIVRAARGAFVARMDADDVSHPDRLARELRLLGGDSTLCAVGTWASLIDESRNPVAVLESTVASASRRVALERGVLIHATVVGRREWFRANPYDESLSRAEDRDLWCRTVETARFAVIPEPLYVIRVLVRSPDFLEGYLEAQRQNRLLYARYGPRVVGRARTVRTTLASLAKSSIMWSAVKMGLGDRVVRRRGRAPTAADLILIREALDNRKLCP